MKNLKQLNKKGEMTSKQLITLVILIISFCIILFFWSMFNWKGDINRETCQTSVVLRASATFKGLEFRENIPLKCQTDRICLKSGLFSNGCDIYGENVRNVDVGNKEQLLDFIAGDIYSWHQTLGEGKVNFMELGKLERKYCFIDSVYSFNENTKNQVESEGGISQLDIYEYLANKKTDGGKSYLEEIYHYTSADMTKIRNTENINKKIDLNQNYALITSYLQQGTIGSWVAGAATVGIIGAATVFTVVTGGSGGVLLAFVAVAGGSGGYLSYYQHPDPEIPNYGAPVVIPYTAENLQNLQCTSFETLA